jgi:hypothetical protein
MNACALALLIARIHCTCSSKWIHKVAVYDIMAISWGDQTRPNSGLIMGGRVDKSIYNLLHTWPVSQHNIHGTYTIDYFLETFLGQPGQRQWVRWIKSSKCSYWKSVVYLYRTLLCKSQVKAFTAFIHLTQ